MRALRVLAPLLAVLLVPAAGAAAAAPANDDRADAATLSAGADVRGTTVDATREADDPPNCPRDGGDTVWYRYTAPKDGEARIALTTSGGLDASLAVYQVERSTITRVSCGDTSRGSLFGTVDLEEGQYLIRVAERKGSAAGGFRIRFSGVLDEPSSTAVPLGADGQATGSLNPLLRPFARFSRKLSSGRDYRVRVAVGDDPERCSASVRLVSPGGSSRPFGCRDYLLVTPTPETAGTWTIALADSFDGVAPQRYRVSITPAGADDLAPGRVLRAFGVVRSAVSGRGPDAQDVFRLDVTRRAEITLRLRSSGSMRLRLLNERGRRVTSAEVDGDTGQIRTRLRPGRFYVLVDAAAGSGGRYTLSRLTRVITSTTVTWDGSGSREKGPGGSSTVGVSVSGAGGGRATVVLERFDPQFGWRFWQRRTIRIAGGRGAFSVPTAAIGRYRARAEFLGTREASPSRARRAAYLRVTSPLEQ